MINNLINAKSRQYTGSGLTSEKMSVTWRHYISGINTYTLYDTGSTTTFPFAYGGIPVPYDAYFTSLSLASMPYSSRQFPNGSSATISVYADNVLLGSQTQAYGNNVREYVKFDFGRKLSINANQVITLRLQVNGQWWYSATTSIITQR
mgnify:CR=1 FL=1|tara:strand:+ start:60 stop:506 length:447 start_codon:yes stop_codon:yes gene_type:complete